MRLFVGLPAAAAVTAVLFIIMSALIRQDPQIGPAPPPFDPKYLTTTDDTKPKPDVKVRPYDKLQPPPPVDNKWSERAKKPDGTGGWGPPDDGGREPVDLPTIGGARPIIKVPPAYPEQCRSAGAEGSVIVQFDVTDKGEVVNARIISSDHRCFDRAVIKAVSGWKYPAERRTGVTETVTFRLEE